MINNYHELLEANSKAKESGKPEWRITKLAVTISDDVVIQNTNTLQPQVIHVRNLLQMIEKSQMCLSNPSALSNWKGFDN